MVYREESVAEQADLGAEIVEQIRQLYPFIEILRSTLPVDRVRLVPF